MIIRHLSITQKKSGSIEKTVMFVHQATDPPVECLFVPDMALACAEKFAIEEKTSSFC